MCETIGFTIDEICFSFILGNPFYSTLLSKVKKQPMPAAIIPKAAVGFSPSGALTLFYNEEFLATLTIKKARGVLEHEALHIFFRHLSETRFKVLIESHDPKERARQKQYQKLLNIAMDMAINSLIGREKLPEFCVFPDSPSYKHLCLQFQKEVEYYMDRLLEDQEDQEEEENQEDQQGDDQQDDQDGTGDDGDDQDGEEDQEGKGQGKPDDQDGEEDQEGKGQGKPEDTGETLDSHEYFNKVLDPKTGEVSNAEDHEIDVEYKVADIIEKTIEECRDFGYLPAFVTKEIAKLKKPIKRFEWKNKLRVFIASVLNIRKSFTTKRRNRRLSDYKVQGKVTFFPGKKKTRKPRLGYVRDTSMSFFSDAVQAEITNEMQSLAPHADIWVIDCDTEVHQVFRFKNAKDMKPYLGGGGTDFRPAFEKCKELKLDGIIYATDTFGRFLDEALAGKFARKTIWLTFNQPEINVPYGMHVNIDPESIPV